MRGLGYVLCCVNVKLIEKDYKSMKQESQSQKMEANPNKSKSHCLECKKKPSNIFLNNQLRSSSMVLEKGIKTDNKNFHQGAPPNNADLQPSKKTTGDEPLTKLNNLIDQNNFLHNPESAENLSNLMRLSNGRNSVSKANSLFHSNSGADSHEHDLVSNSSSPISADIDQEPWYQPHIQREVALQLLMHEDIGAFMVRDSSSQPGCYALSVRVPKFNSPIGIAHYLIQKTPSNGYSLKGLDKEWPSLRALVTHHAFLPELLPCCLKIPATANSRNSGHRNSDYDRLSDCNVGELI